MESREFELRYKRMWAEYTDQVMTATDECTDQDFAVVALMEEAKNANKHVIQCCEKICKLCPELHPKAVVEIVTNGIPFMRIKK